MLLEICCKCGFVHRDDRIMIGDKPYRAYKPHYHWSPIYKPHYNGSGELIKDDITLHATICVDCCDIIMNWKEFFEQKALTPEKYRVKGSFNAPLPNRLLEWANAMYARQCQYFQFE